MKRTRENQGKGRTRELRVRELTAVLGGEGTPMPAAKKHVDGPDDGTPIPA
jgi:hypothetical protein